ncbi:MAG: hypothetical protein QOC55_2263 [Thermoleophilaceae bacterium]|nr:hypothetical protein [Thermoleophilaceae bacterium]
MRALFCACACVAAAVATAGCGGGDSSPRAKQAERTTVVARRGVTRALARHLGRANPGQRRRAKGYTSCLAGRLKKIPLKFQKGTRASPPVIVGAIRRTKFGINLGAGPTDAKNIERRLRRGGNSALYTRGSTVIAFAGSRPTAPDIAILTNCADRVR